MNITKITSQADLILTVEDGPPFVYSPPDSSRRVRMRVARIRVRWTDETLTGVQLLGVALREDGSEIRWSS